MHQIKATNFQVIAGIMLGSVLFLASCMSNPDDMSECKKINPNAYISQTNYMGIYPGRSTKSDIENLFGQPLREYDGAYWEYNEATVTFDGDIVVNVRVQGGSTILNDLILKYGCPNKIYLLDVNEEPQNDYSRALFVYPDMGLYFFVDDAPVGLKEPVTAIFYFAPNLKSYSYLLASTTSELTSWNEVIHE